VGAQYRFRLPGKGFLATPVQQPYFDPGKIISRPGWFSHYFCYPSKQIILLLTICQLSRWRYIAPQLAEVIIFIFMRENFML
jgi:hypothetical protein